MTKLNKLFFFVLLFGICLMASCTPNKEITSITVNQESNLTFMIDEFDVSEIVINVNYSDNTIDKVVVTSEMITKGLDKINEAGKHILEITYKNVKCEVEVEITERTIRSVEVNEDCNKVFEENKFDASELRITVTYSDGSVIDIKVNEDMITSGLDKVNEVGTHVLEITYKSFKCNVTIQVVEGLNLEDYTFEKLSNGDGYSITGYIGK